MGAHSSVWRLDVLLSLPDGRLLVESNAGFGKSPDAALGDALNKFATGALHVLLEAFLGVDTDSQVEEETWESGGTSWKAIIGPLLCIGKPPPAMNQVLDALRDNFASLRASARPHWIRVYRGSLNGRPMTLEVLLDNAPWAALAPGLEPLEWQDGSEFRSQRLFVAVVPADAHEAAFLAEPESVQVGFETLLNNLEHEPDCDDTTLFQWLTIANVEPSVAERLIAFVPLAFAELVLTEAHHSSNYVLLSDPERRERPLRDEPTYAIAKDRAGDARKTHPIAFQSLAERSATMNAAKQLSGDEQGLANAHFTATLVFLGRFRPPEGRDVDDSPSASTSATPALDKPWWRFW
jgi:hypothetical protein